MEPNPLRRWATAGSVVPSLLHGPATTCREQVSGVFVRGQSVKPVVAGELEIVALPRHPDRDPPDAGPRIEPGPLLAGVGPVGRARAIRSPDPPATATSAESSAPVLSPS